jgi:ATP-dependent Clp protease ATP-binding subunit ClpC
MTTNIGAEQIAGKDAFGFSKKDSATNYEKMKNMLKQEMERNFRPEFLNRVDDIIVFRSLNDDDLKHIIDIELAKVIKRLKEKSFTLVMTDEAKTLLIEKGTNKDFGARPLRRAIEHNLEDPLAEDLLRGAFQGKDTITVRVTEVDGEKKIVFDATAKAPPPAPAPELVAAGSTEEPK